MVSEFQEGRDWLRWPTVLPPQSLELFLGSRYSARIWDELVNFSLVGGYLAQKIPQP